MKEWIILLSLTAVFLLLSKSNDSSIPVSQSTHNVCRRYHSIDMYNKCVVRTEIRLRGYYD